MRKDTNEKRRCVATVIVAMVVSVAGIAVATPAAAQAWKGDQSPTMQDLVPDLASTEAYSERYSFKSGLKGGGSVKFNFTISNLGWGNGQAAVKVQVKSPNRENYKYKTELSRSEWSYNKDAFGLKMKETTVEAVGENHFKLRHDGDVKVEMELSSNTKMWSPGELRRGDQYFRLDFYALKADMEGRVNYDGSWQDIEGDKSGYGEHAATNIAPYNLAKRFSKSRVYDSDNQVYFIWREIKLTEEFGGQSVGFILAGYQQQIVLTDNNPTVKFGKVKTDKETGYRVPRAVQVEGKQGGDSIKLVMRGSDMKRDDLLDRYGAIARMVASSMTDPYNYYFDMEWGLTMDIKGTQATVRGDGGYVIDWVNK